MSGPPRASVMRLAVAATALTAVLVSVGAAVAQPAPAKAAAKPGATQPAAPKPASAAPDRSATGAPTAAKGGAAKAGAAKADAAKGDAAKGDVRVEPAPAVAPAPEASPDGALLPSEPATPAPARGADAKTAPAGGQPLTLRPPAKERPLDLAQDGAGGGWWYKLLACALIVAGAVWLIRKRKLLVAPASEPSLRILERTSIGVRSELLVVRVDGQRLLLGITPSTIARLCVLPDGAEQDGVEPALAAEPATEPLETIELEPGFARAMSAARERMSRLTSVLGRKPAVRAAVPAATDEPDESYERDARHAEHSEQDEHDRDRHDEHDERARGASVAPLREPAPVRRLPVRPEPGKASRRTGGRAAVGGQAATLIGLGRKLGGAG